MTGEISLDERNEVMAQEGEGGPLEHLEEKVGLLLMRYQEIKKEKDELAVALDMEKEKRSGLEKRLELLSQDRDKVKTRIDQLLHRLKGLDI